MNPSSQENDDHVRKKDAAQKEKAKRYADRKMYVKVSDIIPGDKVLVKNAEKGKLKPVFDPRPYVVTERKGSMITAFGEEPRHMICRNSSFVKQKMR